MNKPSATGSTPSILRNQLPKAESSGFSILFVQSPLIFGPYFFFFWRSSNFNMLPPFFTSLVAAAILLMIGCHAQATPPAPGLTFLYSLNCTLGASVNVGTGPRGSRTVIPITGGTFTGPRLTGMSTSWSLAAKGFLPSVAVHSLHLLSRVLSYINS